ncbi:DNA repair and recombination helicase protein PIF7 [Novymonas esmeraldas]|uniref:ATP-dependent DNA helicase n=1 Tax=Novymonas esmeraldas TaxID=1808958 RepID=A0AAW0ETX4_9TRYP
MKPGEDEGGAEEDSGALTHARLRSRAAAASPRRAPVMDTSASPRTGEWRCQSTPGSDSRVLLPDDEEQQQYQYHVPPPVPPRPLSPISSPSMTASCTSPAPLLSMRGSGHTSTPTPTAAPLLFTCSGSPAQSSASATGGHLHCASPATSGSTPGTQGRESAVTVLSSNSVTESTAPPPAREEEAEEEEAEEVVSCTTLSSTVTSPVAAAAATPALPPPAHLRLPSSTPSDGSDRRHHATTPSVGSVGEATMQHSGRARQPDVLRTAPSFSGPHGSRFAALALLSQSLLMPALASAPRGRTRAAARRAAARPAVPIVPYRLLDPEICTPTALSTTTAARRATATVKAELPAPSPPLDESATQGAPVPPLPELSSEQRYAFHVAVKEHRTVFITGGAGTGKSHLLRTIIRALPVSSTFVTATTGIAALNLSGSTLHSFAGCGIPNRESTLEHILWSVMTKENCVRRWRLCRVLIIDEVSMLEASFFDLVDHIARHVRNRPTEPFGGVQLILSGDFLQLPPVSRDQRGRAHFCFETETWRRVNPRICVLSTPFRQRDLRFFSILNEMRFGEMRPESAELLYSLDTTEHVHFVRRIDTAVGDCPAVKAETSTARPTEPPLTTTTTTTNTSTAENMGQTRLQLVNGVGRPIDAVFDGYTILRSTRTEVDVENQHYYKQLTTEVYFYQGLHTGKGTFPEASLPKVVQVRRGCRVMLIKNLDPRIGLVNGSTGTVTDFVSFSKGYYFKTQNMTFADARAVCVGRGSNSAVPHTMLPVIAFDMRDATGTVTTRELVLEPQEWVEKLGSTAVSRSVQMPLILAYAITIHKSQGMSLTQVDIDFKRVFEAGQSYVALSRCTDMAHVRLHSFDARRVSTNATALAYYKALALQQERLRWRRSHEPQSVVAEEAQEAFSCTPYGYVLRHEAQALRQRGRDELAQRQRSISGGSSTSTSSRRSRGLMKTEVRPAGPVAGPVAGDGALGPRESRRRHRSRDDDAAPAGDSGGGGGGGGGERAVRGQRRRRENRRTWVDEFGAARHRGSGSDDSADEEGGDDGGVVNETVRLDRLRRRITPLLATASMVRQVVTREVVPLHCVSDARIVVDANSVFQLLAGRESAAAFDVLFGERGNMLRVPLCVHALVAEAAAYRSGSSSVSHSTADGSASRPDDAAVPHSASRVEPANASLLTASEMAAEALVVMERAKNDFILDVQRPGQACALPEPNPGWRRFEAVLPLLHRGPQRRAATKEEEEGAVEDAGREVDFILSRDPREGRHHRDVLEYAAFLQRSYGEGIVVCTDSVLLAAYALAWGLRVSSMDYLCGDAANA